MRWGDQNLIPMCLSIATIEKHTQPYTLDSLLLLGACSNVFIYSYHIETRSPEWTLPRPTVGSVFLYGRTTRTRTGNWQIKSLL